ncbi:LuxR C-terminal-related transcriptional regulator [Pseudonocardia nematodicida]|uniref:LuxR C-terminal-related transcriptional regulator n=1 Tax=Pseudonocardia nematodicida TaxID=1206997 RepID=A0ABV1KEQ4_9PSEU
MESRRDTGGVVDARPVQAVPDMPDVPRPRTSGRTAADPRRSGRGRPAAVRVPRAKIRVPTVGETHVPRPRVTATLSEMARRPVLLVSAPAGCGKTQALADWARRTHGPARIAWVTVDRDDDTSRFWSALLEAVRQCAGIPASSELHRLSSPAAGDELEMVGDLADAVDVLPDPVHLVLDDVHEIRDEGVRHLLDLLLRHLPPNLHLILSSRLDPPLPLPRLRLEGRLAELRAEHLRFSVADARELLRRSDVDISREQAAALVDRTDGWAAGLRLAAISLQGAGPAGGAGRPEPADGIDDIDDADRPGVDGPGPGASARSDYADRVVADFAGADRAVADYLADEVLSGVPPELRNLLGLLSIGDETPVDLAIVLAGRDDAAGLLARLERETALVVGVGPGRRSYRLHGLLRTYLAAELERENPGEARRLHAAAARWYADSGDTLRALSQARAGAAEELLAEILQSSGVDLLLAHEHEALCAALEALPDHRLRDSPRLCLVAAAARTRAGRADLARADLARARTARSSGAAGPADADLDVFERLVEIEIGLLTECCAPPAPDDPPGGTPVPGDPALEAWARADRGRSLIFAQRTAPAVDELGAALDLAEEHRLEYLAVRVLADLALLRGVECDYPAMVQSARNAIATARARGWSEIPALIQAHSMCAMSEIVSLRPAAAAGEIASAGLAARTSPDRATALVLDALGAVAEFDRTHRERSPDTLLEVMRRCRTELEDGPPGRMAPLGLLEFHPAAVHRRTATLREIVTWAERALPGTADPLVLRAHARLLAGRPAAARDVLGPVLRDGLPCVLPTTGVDAWLVQAGADLAVGRVAAARRGLVQALELAAPGTLIRPFRYADPQLIGLLVQHIGTFGRELEPLVELVVRRAPAGPETSGVPALTERERAVLTLLQSHRSIEEIASDLTVSANTVKTHVRSIYGKLGVNSRRAAVVVARERSLV